jgi:hypothetical protein
MFNRTMFMFVIFLLILNTQVLSYEHKLERKLDSIEQQNLMSNRKTYYDNLEVLKNILARKIARLEKVADELNFAKEDDEDTDY